MEKSTLWRYREFVFVVGSVSNAALSFKLPTGGDHWVHSSTQLHTAEKPECPQAFIPSRGPNRLAVNVVSPTVVVAEAVPPTDPSLTRGLRW